MNRFQCILNALPASRKNEAVCDPDSSEPFAFSAARAAMKNWLSGRTARNAAAVNDMPAPK